MNTLHRIDSIYAELIEVGFITLREAIASGDLSWAAVEVELLHNIPSLIGELNWARHDYFIGPERETYLAWISQASNERAKSRMRTFYAPLWNDLEVLIKSRQRE